MFKEVLFSTAVILVLFTHFYSKGYFKMCFNFILTILWISVISLICFKIYVKHLLDSVLILVH